MVLTGYKCITVWCCCCKNDKSVRNLKVLTFVYFDQFLPFAGQNLLFQFFHIFGHLFLIKGKKGVQRGENYCMHAIISWQLNVIVVTNV